MPDRLTDAELERIYDATITDLYRYVSRRCGGQRELAEDVTQEAWLRAIKDWNQKGVPPNPIGWLTTVARNLLLNHFRKREGVSIDDVSPTEIMNALESDNDDSAEVASIVCQALMRMPDAEARLLETFHFDRWKMSQLAEAYGTTEKAIEGRLRRARERLKKELGNGQWGMGNRI
jgi:RNA polymerase sigma-70 factor (ECF subfamily)